MTKQRLKVAAAIAVLAAAAIAASGGTSIARPTNSRAQSGVYKLEPTHARVLFSVSHAGFSTWYGEFPGAQGQLDLDATNLARSAVSVALSTAAISTSSAVLDTELRGPAWFDAARFPAISFRSRQVRLTGAAGADVLGDLTLHGVTKPITLHARFNAAGINPFTKTYTVGFELTGSLKRSDFGVREDLPLIGDDVTLMISAPFEKQG